MNCHKNNPVRPKKRLLLPGQALMVVLFLMPLFTSAQNDSAAKKEPEAPAIISPAVDFISIQKGDNTIDLKATLKAKINGTLTKLEELPVLFFSTSDSGAVELGKAVTDRNGTATLNCQAANLVTDKEGKLHFKASFAGNKSIEAAEEVLAIKKARLSIVPVKEDSLISVKLALTDVSTGAETVIPEADLGVYVKRMFNPLKIGEGKTDANGQTTVEVPKNLPGDPKGNLILIARLDDNELYGNLETSVSQQWGVPVSDELRELPRSLFSTHPPVWMVVTFIVLMTAVWGHYLVIIYELFRLRKDQP